MLAKKREMEAKFKAQGKPDKVYMAQEEIKEVRTDSLHSREMLLLEGNLCNFEGKFII